MFTKSFCLGWEGDNCESDIDECAGNATLADGRPSCERGQCKNLDGSYECDCSATGYNGT